MRAFVSGPQSFDLGLSEKRFLGGSSDVATFLRCWRNPSQCASDKVWPPEPGRFEAEVTAPLPGVPVRLALSVFWL